MVVSAFGKPKITWWHELRQVCMRFVNRCFLNVERKIVDSPSLLPCRLDQTWIIGSTHGHHRYWCSSLALGLWSCRRVHLAMERLEDVVKIGKLLCLCLFLRGFGTLLFYDFLILQVCLLLLRPLAIVPFLLIQAVMLLPFAIYEIVQFFIHEQVGQVLIRRWNLREGLHCFLLLDLCSPFILLSFCLFLIQSFFFGTYLLPFWHFCLGFGYSGSDDLPHLSVSLFHRAIAIICAISFHFSYLVEYPLHAGIDCLVWSKLRGIEPCIHIPWHFCLFLNLNINKWFKYRLSL